MRIFLRFHFGSSLSCSNHLLLGSLLRRCFTPRKGWNDVPMEWVQIVRGRRPKAEQWPLAPGHRQNRARQISQQGSASLKGSSAPKVPQSPVTTTVRGLSSAFDDADPGSSPVHSQRLLERRLLVAELKRCLHLTTRRICSDAQKTLLWHPHTLILPVHSGHHASTPRNTHRWITELVSESSVVQDWWLSQTATQ